MSTSDRGGWKSVRFATTTGFTTSTQITNILNGTEYQSSNDNDADGRGRDLSSRFAITGTIRTSAFTLAAITTLETHAVDLDTIFIKYVSLSDKVHKIGPVILGAVDRQGNESGSFNSVTIAFNGAGEKRSDLLTFADA